MCFSSFGPPFGIPIPPEVHEQYAQDVKEAWTTFDAWWKDALNKADGGLVKSDTMPANVRAAFDLINKTPIPGQDGSTSAESCYMIAVTWQMES